MYFYETINGIYKHIYLQLLLAEYIDSTFEGLIDPPSISISIRYFLCLLDKFAKDYNIEPEVLESWKNEW